MYDQANCPLCYRRAGQTCDYHYSLHMLHYNIGADFGTPWNAVDESLVVNNLSNLLDSYPECSGVELKQDEHRPRR